MRQKKKVRSLAISDLVGWSVRFRPEFEFEFYFHLRVVQRRICEWNQVVPNFKISCRSNSPESLVICLAGGAKTGA